MHTTTRLSILALVLVACGGSTPPPSTSAAPPDAPPAEAKATETAKPAETTKPADAPGTADAKPGATKADINGMWCGKQVPEASKCTGDDVMFMTITPGADAPNVEICEAFNKKHDCAKVESVANKDGVVALELTWGKKKKSSLSLKPNADGTLAGEFKAEKQSLTKTFYRVK